MDTSRLLALIDKFEGALGEHDSDRALVALSSLEELDPDDAAWPKRRAEIYREAGDEASELDALLRTASLQVDAGFVAHAMASCSRILEISPGHPPTEEMMSLLYEMPSTTASETSAVDLSKVAPATPETPLQEIVLTDVVAGTRRVALTDVEESSGVAEISLGNDQSEELDLFLDDVAEDDLGGEKFARPHAGGGGESRSQRLMGSLFRSIGREGARELVRDGEIIDLPADVPVISQGEASDRLFVVLEGAVIPVSEVNDEKGGGIRMGVIESGDFFGEIGLLTGQPRTATVRTLVDTRLLAIDQKAVWNLLGHHEETLTLLLTTLRTRLIDLLVRTHPMFNLFGRARRGAFAKQFRLLEVRDGSTVIEQGLIEQGLFVVLAGRLEVIEASVDGDKSLAMVGHGDVLGESSELFQQSAHASVVARSKCWLLTLSHSRFRAIARNNPRLSDLLRSLARERDVQRREDDDSEDLMSFRG